MKDAGFVFAPRKISYIIKGFKKCRGSQLKAASFVQGPSLKSANYHDEIEQDYTYNSLFDLNKGIATGISSELTAIGAINMLVTAEDVSIIAVTNVATLAHQKDLPISVLNVEEKVSSVVVTDRI